MKSTHFFAVISLIVLAGCGGGDQIDESSGTMSSAVATSSVQSSIGLPELILPIESNSNVLTIPQIGIELRSSVPLTTEPTFMASQFVVKGTGANTLYVNATPYGRMSQGLHDWMISDAIARSMKESDACALLYRAESDHESLYIPVRDDRVMLCDSWKEGDNVFVAAVGYGWAFEGTDYPVGVLLVLRDNDMIVVEGAVEFPVFDEARKKRYEDFTAAHPDVLLWPPNDPIAQQFWASEEAVVQDMINGPSDEAAFAIPNLIAFATSLSFID